MKKISKQPVRPDTGHGRRYHRIRTEISPDTDGDITGHGRRHLRPKQEISPPAKAANRRAKVHHFLQETNKGQKEI